MSTKPEVFNEVEIPDFDMEYVANEGNCLIIDGYFGVPEARLLRDWLNRVIPEVKPSE